MKCVQASGYNERFRYEVLKSAIHAHDKIRDDDRNGIKPMYIHKVWKQAERRQENKRKRKGWYTKGGYETMMFVHATPNFNLRNKLQE